MLFLPALKFGLLNGWLLLLAYFGGLILNVLAFPRDLRRKLFYEPAYPRDNPRYWILMLGRVCAITFVVLMLFTPLRTGTLLFYIGLGVYLIGYAVVMLALIDYKRAPLSQPVQNGLYRFLRNPQWLGLVMVYLGASLAVGGWLHLLLVAELAAAYHFQILLEEAACQHLYGEAYEEHKRATARYLKGLG